MRAWLLLGSLLLAACGSSSSDTVTVFAASSLKGPFTEIEALYEQRNPGTDVTLNYSGSADLVAQLDAGAPGDVLATADELTMRRSGSPDARIFATNTMTIVVQAGNPENIRSLADVADPDLLLSVCAPQVPCGAATAHIAQNAGIDLVPDSEESAVADVLGKVSSGQADVGIVYLTDVRTAPGVQAVAIPDSVNTVNRYPIAAVDPAGEPFAAFVLGDDAQAVLRAAGFGAP